MRITASQRAKIELIKSINRRLESEVSTKPPGIIRGKITNWQDGFYIATTENGGTIKCLNSSNGTAQIGSVVSINISQSSDVARFKVMPR